MGKMSYKCELLENVNRVVEYLQERIDTLVSDRDREDVVQTSLKKILDQWIEDLRLVLNILSGEEVK
ncbi:MAG: hypothetical protein DRO36_06975 [Candidatus Hecatellales archaeon]|nr:MAG: hypothetical protein DRO36_06975 [Candidatus Hecatellales archaeon]